MSFVRCCNRKWVLNCTINWIVQLIVPIGHCCACHGLELRLLRTCLPCSFLSVHNNLTATTLIDAAVMPSQLPCSSTSTVKTVTQLQSSLLHVGLPGNVSLHELFLHDRRILRNSLLASVCSIAILSRSEKHRNRPPCSGPAMLADEPAGRAFTTVVQFRLSSATLSTQTVAAKNNFKLSYVSRNRLWSCISDCEF